MIALLILGLATWRVSSLLVNEDGPFAIFARLRTRAGVYVEGEVGQLGQLLSCVWCTSIWVAIGLAPLLAFEAGVIALTIAGASSIAIFAQVGIDRMRE